VRRGAAWKIPLAAAAAVLLAGVAWWRMKSPGGPSAPASTIAAEQTVAVLPFANLSGDAAQDYVSDGLTVGIIDELMRERALRVPGPVSSFAFKGKKLPAPEIARALNVARLVEGSVQFEGARARIRVGLTRAADGFTEPLGQFEHPVKDLLALQDDIARAVVAKLTRRPHAPVMTGLTRNPAAYEIYLRARTLQTRSAVNVLEAAKLYEQAVQLDPAFALAWARLAEARIRLVGAEGDESPERIASAREALDTALALQPDLPEALLVQARIQRILGADDATVERTFARVEAVQPAHPQLRFAQAWLAVTTRPWPEARRLMQDALSLDPHNGNNLVMAAASFFLPRGEFAEAHRLYLTAGTISGPEDQWFVMQVRVRMAWRGDEAALHLVERTPPGKLGGDAIRAELLVRLDRHDEARAVVAGLEKGEPSRRPPPFSPYYLAALHTLGLAELAHGRAEAMRARAQSEIARGNHAAMQFILLAHAERVLGRHEAALAAMAQWRRNSAARRQVVNNIYPEAIQAYASLGRTEDVVALLREQFEAGVMRQGYSMRRDPLFAPVRGEPRFQALMKQAEAQARAQPDPADL
jgi:TolB-like protein